MIKKNLILFSLLIIITGIYPSDAFSQISVKSRLDSVNLLMGNLMTLHLEVVEPEGSKGSFPIFTEDARVKGYASVCGDSVELKTSYESDTIALGSGTAQINYSIPVQAFDSGTYSLPRLAYVVGKDTSYSNHLTFNVVPVSVTAEDPIAGFAPVSEPDGARFYDWIPDVLLDFWWVWLIIFLTVCAFIWGLRNYKKQGTLGLVITKPMPKPWESALNQLEVLKNRKLWEQGLEKEYFTELTDILRTYLFERFGINAMEMTTRQIMDILFQSDIKDKKEYVRHILNVADFVKFAKVRPLPADNIAAYENAVKFVKETIPTISPEDSAVNENISKEGGENK